MGNHTRHTAALAVLVALGVSACGAGDDAADDGIDEAPAEMPAEPAGELAGGGDEGGASADIDAEDAAAAPPGRATGGARATAAPLDLDGIGRAVAVEAGVTIGTPNLREAVDDTLEVVRRHNASVSDAQVDIGDVRDDGSVDGNARIVVKVPPADLDPLIADLDGSAGTLVGRTQQSEDVTEQLVDLDIRIRVEEQTIARFETLLAEATEFQDIVTIQSAITDHTIALERLLAGQRDVEGRVELSTLTIDLVYRAPVTGDPVAGDPVTDDGIGDAFRSGWDTFVGVLFAIGLVLAVAAPFLVLAVLVLGAAWLLARRRAGRPAPVRTGDGPRVTSDDEQLVGPSPRG